MTNGRDGGGARQRMPVVFAAHGAPVLLDDPAWMAELAAWARALPRPTAILMVSAHWEQRPTTLGATTTVPLVHDFHGFPARYYATTYPAPGAYVPLVAMWPDASIPVLQVSMPALEPRELFRLGQTLAPLRDDGVLVFGSGFLTHNMRYAFRPGTPAWAHDFDAWVTEALARFDVDALLDFAHRAPSADLALPTTEHYAPLLVAAGAAAGQRPRIAFPITGWWLDGAFTKRSVQFD